MTDVFMLGDDILVAPLVNEGTRTRTVCLPEGEWEYVDGIVCTGGRTVVPAPMDVLSYFIKR